MWALVLFLAVNMPSFCRADNWAVLIAGSNDYYNYRHQADVSHAYQLLSKKGNIPEENIIVMMYDDIAENSENPFKGKIFNKPNGTNVYLGLKRKIDYRGPEVNKVNFLKVLKGDSSASGPVLKSTAGDDVFVYYSDHGGVGIVAMPGGDLLYADELIEALKYMHAHKMFNQLVFYLEACESGSMFEKSLPKDLNIFATTASNPSESSYAVYFWNAVNTYVGDEYSVRWLEDSDKNLESGETLIQQFNRLKKEVHLSHPQMYGNTSFDKEDTSDFQGNSEGGKGIQMEVINEDDTMAVDSRDVKLFYFMKKYESSDPSMKPFWRKQMMDEIDYRGLVAERFESIVSRTIGVKARNSYWTKLYTTPSNWECLKSSVEMYTEQCDPFDDYSFKFVRVLVNLCERYEQKIILESIAQTCMDYSN